jgi:hypothetical protein
MKHLCCQSRSSCLDLVEENKHKNQLGVDATRGVRRWAAGGVEVWTTLGRPGEERAMAQGLTASA